ncbi:unnamed protein product [Caenorhabditis bovis]|uniref:Uncharacterized protein n=1 Tax=Caenorhabditis bovis TaxID=2654633 RepID=A0A8S1FFZ9_9PELO|nr:unnamed protein product [Caenorhabditis bovis]
MSPGEKANSNKNRENRSDMIRDQADNRSRSASRESLDSGYLEDLRNAMNLDEDMETTARRVSYNIGSDREIVNPVEQHSQQSRANSPQDNANLLMETALSRARQERIDMIRASQCICNSLNQQEDTIEDQQPTSPSSHNSPDRQGNQRGVSLNELDNFIENVSVRVRRLWDPSESPRSRPSTSNPPVRIEQFRCAFGKFFHFSVDFSH